MTTPDAPDPDGLTPRQAALVDSVTTRLWSGTPMNQYDFLVFSDVAHMLGLERRPSPSPAKDAT